MFSIVFRAKSQVVSSSQLGFKLCDAESIAEVDYSTISFVKATKFRVESETTVQRLEKELEEERKLLAIKKKEGKVVL